MSEWLRANEGSGGVIVSDLHTCYCRCEEVKRLTAETNRLAHESDLRANERDKAEARLQVALEVAEAVRRQNQQRGYPVHTEWAVIVDKARTALARIETK